MILVREEISKEILEELGVHKPSIRVTADPAFIYPRINKTKFQEILTKEAIKKNSSPLIGVTVRNWNYPHDPNPKLKFEKYKRTIVDISDYLIEKLSATIVFIPMVTTNFPSLDIDERAIAREIKKNAKHKNKMKIIEGEYSPEYVRGIIGEMDLLIGTRFHSVIFAITMGVPVVAIAYEHKATGIMKMLDLERFVCDINELDVSELILKVDEARSKQEEIRHRLNSNVSDLQKLAYHSVELIKQMLERGYLNSDHNTNSGSGILEKIEESSVEVTDE